MRAHWASIIAFVLCIVTCSAVANTITKQPIHRFVAAAASQKPVFSLGPVTTVSSLPGEDVKQLWPSVDASGQHFIVCGMEEYPEQSLTQGYLDASGDGGKTWHRTMAEHGTQWVSEESCTFGQKGRAYFVAGESDMSTGLPRHEWGHIHVFSSNNYGTNWTPRWIRKDGWIDWTYTVAVPAKNGRPSAVVIMGNSGTRKLGAPLDVRPAATVSYDGGRSFSNLVTAQPRMGYHYAAVWASGGTVLPHGTVLFATQTDILPDGKSQWRVGFPEQVEVFAYSPVRNTFVSRAVLRRIASGTMMYTAAMAHDTSAGPFHGRLYVAWTETRRKDLIGRAWLGISDDNGYHWSIRRISPESCLDDLQLGIDPNGTLGLLWLEDEQRLRFAISKDGGHTFSRSTIFASDPVGPRNASVVPSNEYSGAEYAAIEAGKSLRSYFDPTHPGLGIRLVSGRPGDYALLGVQRNLFEGFWLPVKSVGTHAIVARTVRLSSVPSQTNPMITSVASHCPSNELPQNLPRPTATPSVVNPTGKPDITDSFLVHVQDARYDRTTQIVSADVLLKNKGTKPIVGRLVLSAVGLHGDFGPVVAENAGGVMHDQPFWDATSILPAQGLQPGAISKPITLRFKMTHFTPLPSVDTGDAASMWIHIFQKS